ncbi:PH domain-containing protein [Streptomyces rutgersensis]|uniref:PH domain-containing protein n=1 Tax=Streptomyces rutgersensis TaxID=53451 RepID=UPI00358DB918
MNEASGPPHDEAAEDGPRRTGPARAAGPVGDASGQAPVSAGRPGSGERRLHPVTPLRRAWAPVALLAGWALHDPGSAYRHVSDLATSTLLLGLGVLLPAAALYGFLSWWVTHFSVTDTELRIRTGVLFRRTAHIRLDRLQAVDVTQPLLARFLGVAKLKMDVIGTSSKDELAYLGEPDARALRAELLARAAGFAPETAGEVGEAPVRRLVRVAPRMLAVSLLLTATTWLSLVGALIVPGFLWFATHNLWTVLAAGLPLLGAAGATSAGRFVREYDWTLGESPDGLRLDHGLLDRSHETVPPGRVQTVRVVEPWLWRRLGWVRVELDVAGSQNGVLLPVADRATAREIISRVLAGAEVPEEFLPPPGRAAWCVPAWWRGYGLAVTDRLFAARHGLFHRTVALVPHAKVQSVRLEQGPWQRHQGVADLHVDTGASKTVTAHLRDATEAAALLREQADRSRTSRRTAHPDRWMTGPGVGAEEGNGGGTGAVPSPG